MPGYEDTHWAETERSVADFIKKLGKIPAEDRSAEAMVEIAIQLMWINAHLSKSYIPSFTALQMIDDAPQSNWSTTRLR
jgi:hypothetical protein